MSTPHRFLLVRVLLIALVLLLTPAAMAAPAIGRDVVVSEIGPTLATTSAPRKPRARRWWALALVVILALGPLHCLLFQG